MKKDRLGTIFAAVLGIESENLSDSDSPGTIAKWDSVNHIHLILAIEGEFGIQFNPGEIADLNSVGAIRDRLDRELHRAP